MNRFHRHLVFWTLLGLLALAFISGSWWCLSARRMALAAERRLVAKRNELKAICRLTPAPTTEVAELIAAELVRAEEVRQTMQQTWDGNAVLAGPLASMAVPATCTDAYLDLHEFVEKTREQARKLGVDVAAEEHFGFAIHAQGGPEPEYIAAVYRQRIVAQHLLEALLECRPKRIIAVQRERPRIRPDTDPYPGTGPGAQDFFDMEAGRSARVAEIIETNAFRLKFAGHTPVLRELLNRLAADELPLIVRMVEAEPMPTGNDSSPGGIQPLVSPRVMKFTVTIEHFQLITQSAPAS